MFDRPVFARRIHGLENEQDSPLVLGIKFVLQGRQCLHALRERLFGTLFVLGVEFQRVAGIAILEPEVLSGGDAEGRGEISGAFDEFIGFHGIIGRRGAGASGRQGRIRRRW